MPPMSGMPPIPPIPGGSPPIPGGAPPPGAGGGPDDLAIATTSSILRIIQATSEAAEIICSFTDSGSIISLDFIFAVRALITSMPVHCSPLSCLERKDVKVSIGSIPAVSAKAKGIDSNASANFSAASCSLPSNDFAQLRIFVAVKVSGEPPPPTIDGVYMTSFTTIIAS